MPLNIDFQQIFLHLFNFTLLFAILYYLLYRPVKNFMAKREEYYEKMDAEANQHLADAIKQKNEYQTLRMEADSEISEEKKKIHRELDMLCAKRISQAEETAAKIISEARHNAEKEKENILKSAQDEISEMVTTATEKLVLESSASEAFEQFLDAAEGGSSDDSIYQ